jgi:hypothetical protein
MFPEFMLWPCCLESLIELFWTLTGLQTSSVAGLEGLKTDASAATAAADKENGGAANMEGLPAPQGTEPV